MSAHVGIPMLSYVRVCFCSFVGDVIEKENEKHFQQGEGNTFRLDSCQARNRSLNLKVVFKFVKTRPTIRTP